ncbi:MAG: zinc ribbon domain-containing protein [Lachnospiraceae bacterium]|nr:zinc ribbon domain-containing protein [Lachnospiraceae bacterium]
MAGLKDTVSKSFTAINLKKNNFVTINKINTYISTLEHEISSLYSRMGTNAYARWKKDGGFDTDQLNEFCEKIREKEEEIARQKARIQEIEEEENQILGRNEDSGEEIVGRVYCAFCGTANSDQYKFCVKCGKPL